MADIDKDIAKALGKYETRQLECILNALENEEYYGTGLSHINGAYASAEVTDLLTGEDDDDLTGVDDDNCEAYDVVEILLEAGEQDMGDGHSSCDRAIRYISRRYLGDEKMSLDDKANKVTDLASGTVR